MTYRCVCGDPREQHRQGRRGCKALDCGCDRFEGADVGADRQRVLAAVAEVGEDQAATVRAELATVPFAELDEARAKARAAEHSGKVAAERYEADLTRLKTHLVNEQARLRGHIEKERGKRLAVEAELASARAKLDLRRLLLTQAADWVVARDTGYVCGGCDRQIRRGEAYLATSGADEYLHVHCPDGASPATDPDRLVGAYGAWSCLTANGCGARYTVAYPEHGCGALTPVTVTITRRADR